MTRKTRLIILLVCVVCFLVGVPYIVLYSLGYRVDFEHTKIIATGGIYVRTFPSADQIIVDAKYFEKPGIFANSVFVQNLLPEDHSVSIKKAGYYDYYKTLPVQEKEVTKLENVSLFKKDIAFQLVAEKNQNPFLTQNQPDKFTIKTLNLYYSDTPQNANLTTLQKNTPVIKNLVAFTISNNNIIWLGVDGFLHQSSLDGKNPVELSSSAFKIAKNGSYKIIIYGQNTFVNNNGELLLFNNATKDFNKFASQVKDAKFSFDGKNLIYFTANEIYISLLADEKRKKNLLYKSADTINDCLWLNDSYIIFTTGNPSTGSGQGKIIISEIDYRGNVNIVTLPQTINTTSGKTISFVSPKIYFSTQENRLYVLTQTNLLATTDKLIP